MSGYIAAGHDFTLIDRQEYLQKIEKNRYYDLVCLKSSRTINVSDQYVGTNPLFLKGFQTYTYRYKKKWTGLDLSGTTIIPNEEIPNFLRNVYQLPRRREIRRLKVLCKEALRKGKDILHWGV